MFSLPKGRASGRGNWRRRTPGIEAEDTEDQRIDDGVNPNSWGESRRERIAVETKKSRLP